MNERMEFDEFLAHYGVLGMKWGVRKRSSSDGPSSREKKKIAKQEKLDAKRRKKTGEIDTRGKTDEEIYKIKADLLYSRDPKKIYANRRLFDYQEIARINGVLENESKIRSKIVPEKTIGQKIEKGVKTAGKLNDNYNAVAKVAYNLGLTNSDNPIKTKITDVKKQMLSSGTPVDKQTVAKAAKTVSNAASTTTNKGVKDDVNDLLALYKQNMR